MTYLLEDSGFRIFSSIVSIFSFEIGVVAWGRYYVEWFCYAL